MRLLPRGNSNYLGYVSQLKIAIIKQTNLYIMDA